MKLRFGHVSNSSTSSFVMYAHDLTTEQKEAMEIAIDNYNEKCHEGYVGRSGRFFIGDVSMHDWDTIRDVITETNIPDELWTVDC